MFNGAIFRMPLETGVPERIVRSDCMTCFPGETVPEGMDTPRSLIEVILKRLIYLQNF